MREGYQPIEDGSFNNSEPPQQSGLKELPVKNTYEITVGKHAYNSGFKINKIDVPVSEININVNANTGLTLINIEICPLRDDKVDLIVCGEIVKGDIIFSKGAIND